LEEEINLSIRKGNTTSRHVEKIIKIKTTQKAQICKCDRFVYGTYICQTQIGDQQFASINTDITNLCMTWNKISCKNSGTISDLCY
jgi:hypothetical protein